VRISDRSRVSVSPRERLLDVLSPDLVAALEELIAERVSNAVGTARNSTGSPWLSVAEAADYLRVSERTLDRLVKYSRVRSTTLGRRRLFHRNDLDALAKAATGEGTAPTVPPRRRKD
jgi:excisionase family DNA binding protein